MKIFINKEKIFSIIQENMISSTPITAMNQTNNIMIKDKYPGNEIKQNKIKKAKYENTNK